MAPAERPVGDARSVPRDAGRAVLVALSCAAGLSALKLVTLADGYGCVRRGTVALQWSSRLLLWSLRIRVVTTGALRSGPSLIVTNGGSWLDAVVLTAAGPMRPAIDPDHLRLAVIGAGARRAGAVCVAPRNDREHGERPPDSRVEAITVALRRGHRVLAFPCAAGSGPLGSDSAGSAAADPATERAGALRVRPGVIQAAVDAGAVVAPVAIRRRPPIAGPLPPADHPGDFARALWRILRSGPATVDVHWLAVIPAIVADGHPSRHRARTADRAAKAINQALAGSGSDQPVVRSSATSAPATANYLSEPDSRTVLMPRLSRSA